MRWLFLSMACLLAGSAACAAPAAGAPEPWRRVVLVELYTSQGCSSCPAADELVRELPRLGLGRDKVVPLAFHVDYWDGFGSGGWKDPFASPSFTRRQEWYAQSNRLRAPDGEAGLSGLYTPQMIVAGTVHFSGQRRTTALAEIRRAAAAPPLVELAGEAVIRGEEVRVSVRATPRDGRPVPGEDWRLVVALAAKRTRTKVLRGENGGETLEEAAVVRRLSDRLPLSLSSREAVTVTIAKPAELAWADVELVAFVQAETTRQVAAAAAVSLPASR